VKQPSYLRRTGRRNSTRANRAPHFTLEAAERRVLLASLSALPLLHSNPTAKAKLYIDFDGAPAVGQWVGFDVPATPAYDTDGDPTTFTSSELSDINEIWARVAEAYSPFNIDVTTQDPGNRNNYQTSSIIVGGSVDTWLKQEAGGVAPLGAFFNDAPNVGFVFSDDAFGDTLYLGQAIAHEAGHTFGLNHHSTFKPDGSVDQEYDPGNPSFGPIMGFPDSGARMLWANTLADVDGKPVAQDDLAILSGKLNRFGYRADDWGNTRLSAGTISTDSAGKFTTAGVIERNTDIDAFNIKAGAGTLSISLKVAQFAPMLDATIKVVDAFGTVIAQKATSSLGESLTANVTAGTYTVIVSGAGNYGDIGTYTLSGSVPSGPDNSDHLLVEGTDFDDIVTLKLVDGAYELVVNGATRTIDPDTIKQFDVLLGDGNDSLTIGPGVCPVYALGGSGNDTLSGGDDNETLSGSAGNDLIFGYGGDDRISGGAGKDIIVGGIGNDRLYGDAGNDVITGGAGVDRLYGGDDNDVLSGESSADPCYGENGNDTLYGGRGTDLLNGGDGLDQLYGGDDNDALYARDSAFDLVNGGAGIDKALADDSDTHLSLEELLA
jgi:Ca2+-binding RTX toxin-like protein